MAQLSCYACGYICLKQILKTSFSSVHPKAILGNYKTIIKNLTLWGFLLSVAFMMAGEKAYTTSAAFLFI